MSGDQFQVKSSDLVSHAVEVDAIGDGLGVAQQAGEAVHVDTDVYGELCQFVPAILNGLQSHLIDGLGTAVAAAHDTADALRSTAADYDAADGNAADRLRSTR
ncbi:type VII secretion target [Actinoplanes sp. KI2]|uniref:type VII secretion target n=1 Tax=Actinoplanes sp. KI2 TaxID=2983315 RepID=UPI0021D5E8B8|nr:type VII secretion target [Actinoplanes sp. KI2]MCU7724309.1 type VII secretion target [Actinoplanes sp. KI2]